MTRIKETASGLNISNNFGNMEFFNNVLDLYKNEWGLGVAKTIRRDIVDGKCLDMRTATYNGSILGSCCTVMSNIGNTNCRVPSLMDVYNYNASDTPSIESVLKTCVMKQIMVLDLKEVMLFTRNKNVKSFYDKFAWEIVDSSSLNGKEALTLLWQKKNSKYCWDN